MTDYKKMYEEALERAKDLHDNHPYGEPGNWWTCEKIFPELKESEDEKIRKELISFLEGFYANKNKDRWIAWLEKQSEQKSNKIEPKFKVGDWIVYNDANVYQVKEIDYTGKIPRYELENIDGDKLSIPFTSDYNLRNWIIQDAKEGDVLFVKPTENLGKQLIVFGGIDSDGRIKYYCRFLNNKFSIDGGLMGYEHKYFLPTTKEQHDLLFQKMKEAGYEWDADNKELKKIEQKPTERSLPYEKNETVEKLIALAECLEMDGDCLFNGLSGDDYGKLLRVLAIELTEVKPAWSEEDDKILNTIINDIQERHPKAMWKINYGNTIAVSTKYIIDWLKSLKDRI